MAARTSSIHVFLGRPLFLLSPGIHNAANYNTVILDNSLLQTVTIPEAAYIQLRRGPPEDEQGNTRNM